MIRIKVRRKTKKLQSIKSAVQKLDGQKTELGYFKSQGMHVGMDGIPDLSYAALAQALELGLFPEQAHIPLPFMNHIGDLTVEGLTRSTKMRRAVKSWSKNLERNASPLPLLDAVGEVGIKQSRKVFNNKIFFPQAPNNETPIFQTGELMRKFTYRTSYDNKVRKT